ncbi:MAG: LysM peptidoglycan-binding domain-containing protein, partial [Bacilli bacterium]
MVVRARNVISAAIVCTSITTPLAYGGVVSAAAPLDNINNDNHIVENIVTGAIKRYFNPLTVIQGGLKNPTALSKTYETYTVQEGDYLGKIADKWNVSIEQLLLANNLDNPHQLRIGQTLKYPVPKFHRIQAGETLEMIAETNDVQLGQLYDANKLEGILPDGLYVGQAIIIPEEIPEQMTRAFTYKPKTGTVTLASRSRSTSSDSSIPTFSWPLDGVLTSDFGKRWGKMHQGLDISHSNKST